MPVYSRIVRRGSKNVRVLLLNGTTVLVPVQEFLESWASAVIGDSKSFEDLTFGIELEFIGVYDPSAVDGLVSSLQSRGIEIEAPLRYGRSSTTKWVLGKDSSLFGVASDGLPGFGYELTSPILKFNEKTFDTLKIILNSIEAFLYPRVNSSCGFHVHVGGFDTVVDMDRVNKVIEGYSKLENIFDSMVSSSRRGDINRYCKKPSLVSSTDKYRKITAYHISDEKGTIECRHHQGTLSLDKIKNWMELVGRFVLYAYNGGVTEYITEFHHLSRKIGLSQNAEEFLSGRIRKLASGLRAEW